MSSPESTSNTNNIPPPGATNSENRALFVGGLLDSTTSEHLQAYFARFGEVEEVNLIIDWVTGKSKRCAIVICKEASTASQVMAQSAHMLDGRKIRVDLADHNKKGTKIVKTKKLFLGHIHQGISEQDLLEVFAKYGEVKHVKILKDTAVPYTVGGDLSPSSQGYLEYRRTEDAQKLLNDRHNLVVKGFKIFCQPFKANNAQEGLILKEISDMSSELLETCLTLFLQMQQFGSFSEQDAKLFLLNIKQMQFQEMAQSGAGYNQFNGAWQQPWPAQGDLNAFMDPMGGLSGNNNGQKSVMNPAFDLSAVSQGHQQPLKQFNQLSHSSEEFVVGGLDGLFNSSPVSMNANQHLGGCPCGAASKFNDWGARTTNQKGFEMWSNTGGMMPMKGSSSDQQEWTQSKFQQKKKHKGSSSTSNSFEGRGSDYHPHGLNSTRADNTSLMGGWRGEESSQRNQYNGSGFGAFDARDQSRRRGGSGNDYSQGLQKPQQKRKISMFEIDGAGTFEMAPQGGMGARLPRDSRSGGYQVSMSSPQTAGANTWDQDFNQGLQYSNQREFDHRGQNYLDYDDYQQNWSHRAPPGLAENYEGQQHPMSNNGQQRGFGYKNSKNFSNRTGFEPQNPSQGHNYHGSWEDHHNHINGQFRGPETWSNHPYPQLEENYQPRSLHHQEEVPPFNSSQRGYNNAQNQGFRNSDYHPHSYQSSPFQDLPRPSLNRTESFKRNNGNNNRKNNKIKSFTTDGWNQHYQHHGRFEEYGQGQYHYETPQGNSWEDNQANLWSRGPSRGQNGYVSHHSRHQTQGAALDDWLAPIPLTKSSSTSFHARNQDCSNFYLFAQNGENQLKLKNRASIAGGDSSSALNSPATKQRTGSTVSEDAPNSWTSADPQNPKTDYNNQNGGISGPNSPASIPQKHQFSMSDLTGPNQKNSKIHPSTATKMSKKCSNGATAKRKQLRTEEEYEDELLKSANIVFSLTD